MDYGCDERHSVIERLQYPKAGGFLSNIIRLSFKLSNDLIVFFINPLSP